MNGRRASDVIPTNTYLAHGGVLAVALHFEYAAKHLACLTARGVRRGRHHLILACFGKIKAQGRTIGLWGHTIHRRSTCRCSEGVKRVVCPCAFVVLIYCIGYAFLRIHQLHIHRVVVLTTRISHYIFIGNTRSRVFIFFGSNCGVNGIEESTESCVCRIISSYLGKTQIGCVAIIPITLCYHINIVGSVNVSRYNFRFEIPSYTRSKHICKQTVSILSCLIQTFVKLWNQVCIIHRYHETRVVAIVLDTKISKRGAGRYAAQQGKHSI